MRSVCFLLCSLPIACTIHATTPAQSETTSGWVALSRMDTTTAREDFTSAPQSRNTRLGYALASLGEADNSPTHLNNSRRELTALRDENSTDDVGIAATFYLARLSQHFDQGSDVDEIISIYRDLLTRYPGHPVAELAAPKLAILLLYADVTAEEHAARFDEIEALLPTLKHPHNQRDTRLILADALLRISHDHQRAYPLINYCLEQNLILRSTRLNQYLLQAAEAARILGYQSAAIRHYETYIEAFPHDNKTDEARRRLERVKEDFTRA